MDIRVRRYRAVAAATAAILASVTAVVAAVPAEAATVKTVRVHMSDSAITFHGGGAMAMDGMTMLPAGRYHFHVVAPSGAHSLQLLRFQNGYTPDQAQQDFQSAFEGDVAAVQRIDNGVLFIGGASARRGKPGDMVARVRAGEVAALDVNGEAMAVLQVTGTGRSASASHSGRYTALTYGWDVSRQLPASGRVKVVNQADQPHFLVLQRVKDRTTNKQVRRFIRSGAQSNPSWALKASADTGVLSPGKSQLISYDLPPGKYFIACFWPDYFTGAPHFLMGMWKLVTLS
jgi:hypothetical protein